MSLASCCSSVRCICQTFLILTSETELIFWDLKFAVASQLVCWYDLPLSFTMKQFVKYTVISTLYIIYHFKTYFGLLLSYFCNFTILTHSHRFDPLSPIWSIFTDLTHFLIALISMLKIIFGHLIAYCEYLKCLKGENLN